MRIAAWFAVLGLAMSTAPAMAQHVAPTPPSTPPALGDLPGPVVDGRHRPPTQAEIRLRQRAEGELTPDLQQRNRAESKSVDELYKELTTPLPPLSGQGGAPE